MKRLWLGIALFAGKALDATTTVVALSLSGHVYESQWLSRYLFSQFGLYRGTVVATVVAVCAVALVAESGVVLARVTPASWTPNWYPGFLRVTTYLVGAAWFSLVAVHNVLLFV